MSEWPFGCLGVALHACAAAVARGHGFGCGTGPGFVLQGRTLFHQVLVSLVPPLLLPSQPPCEVGEADGERPSTCQDLNLALPGLSPPPKPLLDTVLALFWTEACFSFCACTETVQQDQGVGGGEALAEAG